MRYHHLLYVLAAPFTPQDRDVIIFLIGMETHPRVPRSPSLFTNQPIRDETYYNLMRVIEEADDIEKSDQ